MDQTPEQSDEELLAELNAHSVSEVLARIDQKAVRLSALLRVVDNHPIELSAEIRERLDGTLEMLACRVSATRALLGSEARQPVAP